MLRLVHFVILPGMLLTTCAAWVCADTTPSSTAASGKQIYSNRPVGYTVPSPYYGTPMPPRFAVVPGVPYRTTIIARTQSTPQVVVPVPVQTTNMAPVVPVAPAVPVVPVTPVAPVAVVPTQVVEKTTYILREPKPEVNVNDELDAFYARLAKIQVEKHRLTDALNLIEKIKSETCKVRTVVDLAEYVSRDKNYQSEAEQLYRLAITGMESLNRKQPFHVILAPAPVVPQPVVQQPIVPQPVVPPQVQPVPVRPEPVATPQPTPVVPVRPQPIPLEDTPAVQPNTPSPRPPILLQEDSSINNGKRLLPPPDPPRDEKNGIVVSPPTKPLTPNNNNEAPPALTQQPTPPPQANTTSAPSEDAIVRPKPAILLEDEPAPPKPEAKPTVRQLTPIVLEEN